MLTFEKEIGGSGPAAAGDPAGIAQWQGVLSRLRIAAPQAWDLACRAHENATSFLAELRASGLVAEETLYREIAGEIGIAYQEEVEPDRLVMNEAQIRAALSAKGGWPVAMMVPPGSSSTVLLTAPSTLDPAGLRLHLGRDPDLALRLRIIAPSTLRRAMIARCRADLARDARSRLFERAPEFSARLVASAWQGALAGMFTLAVSYGLLVHNQATSRALLLAMSLFFLSSVVLRICAMSAAQAPRPARLRPWQPRQMPVYSVMVALYREEAVVPQLLAALAELHWPRSKLEIKLVCEADDARTLAALEAHRLDPWIEIVKVPPGRPRTKPKALAHALPLCSGELVALYDAEDRPHPLQLVEAWQRFRAAPPQLACLQAPLVVTNGCANMLARLFAFEYAGLFRAKLPWLARHGTFLPLGGTSNHFRRAALVEAGGWDPHNVTEDADLGLRLMRFGYRTQTISRPTFEDAPETLAVWIPQRVRWFKGWMQTWLVHMRSPGMLFRDIGPASFTVVQILLLGMTMSALVHPIFLGAVLVEGMRMAWAGAAAGGDIVLFLVALANVLLGYGAFILLGSLTLMAAEKPRLWKVMAFTPLYWLLLSVAAWSALIELFVRPHHWHKTPHGPSRMPQG